MTVAYDGTNYVGWQRQENGLSVQQVLEEALQPMCGDDVPVLMGAGRTDAGVHASGQVASVRVAFEHPATAVHRALNVRLPSDIRVLAVEDAEPRFHARFDATGKSYRYRIATDRVLLPFDRWFVWHMAQPCDVDAMRAAAPALLGRHDFSSFQATGSAVLDAWRTLERIQVERVGSEIQIEVDGDGFLRHMVRIIVGTLFDVGVGTRSVESMAAALAARDRQAAGRTAPAQGLTLVRIRY
ncbi:MAG: tRNA pseudouridine(38-40) synthase TruA [Acidobacteriota bacterium]